jgi:hypothetical protein
MEPASPKSVRPAAPPGEKPRMEGVVMPRAVLPRQIPLLETEMRFRGSNPLRSMELIQYGSGPTGKPVGNASCGEADGEEPEVGVTGAGACGAVASGTPDTAALE